MATFNQRGQRVTYQYNAAGDINFGAEQNQKDLVRELGKLQGEMTKAIQAGVFSEMVATEAAARLTQAVQEARQPAPEKHVMLHHLSSAITLVGSVSAASGLVTGLGKALELLEEFF